MKKNRREFLKLAGLGLTGAAIPLAGCTTANRELAAAGLTEETRTGRNQRFNMSGYSAPPLEKVRIGFIGLGNRGPGAVSRMSRIEGVEITALCDIRPERIEVARGRMYGNHNPATYHSDENAWMRMCERDDIDLVYIATPWHLHTPQSVYAMEHGKHAATEIPAAVTLDECWQLVETSERTRKHCMMLENCCYDFFELLTLNMARQGFFGDIVHCEGAYIHQLIDNNFRKTQYTDMWRLKQNGTRHGNLYPTHGLGPICQIMDINRGDKMDYLVSMTGDDFMMGARARELAAEDPFYEPFTDLDYHGNINTTTVRTHQGKTIMIQHDVTSPRPYSRIHLVSGTRGIAQKYPLPGRIATSHTGWVDDAELDRLEEEFRPEIVKRIGEVARHVGGHGGMDFIMDWRLIDCLRNGLPLDQDVYDAALWSSIFPLSEWSVLNRSQSIDVPDFTAGAWRENEPVDLLLAEGGNTPVLP